MKKILLLLISFLFFSCTKTITNDGRELTPESFINLETVTEDFSGAIYKDKYTGVLYLSMAYRITAIMKPDGTCLTWDEWVKRGGLNETGN